MRMTRTLGRYAGISPFFTSVRTVVSLTCKNAAVSATVIITPPRVPRSSGTFGAFIEQPKRSITAVVMGP